MRSTSAPEQNPLPGPGDDHHPDGVVEAQPGQDDRTGSWRMSALSAFSFSGRFSTTFATPPSTVKSTDISPAFLKINGEDYTARSPHSNQPC